MITPSSQEIYDSRTIHLPLASRQKPMDAPLADAVLSTLARQRVRVIEMLPEQDLDKARYLYKEVAIRLLNRYLEGESIQVASDMQDRLGIDSTLLNEEKLKKLAAERKKVAQLAKVILENIKNQLKALAFEKNKKAKRGEMMDPKKAAKKELERKQMVFSKEEMETILEPLKNVCLAIKSHEPETLIKLGFKQEYEINRINQELHLLEEYVHRQSIEAQERQEATHAQIRKLEETNEALELRNMELEHRLGLQEALMCGVMKRLDEKAEKN